MHRDRVFFWTGLLVFGPGSFAVLVLALSQFHTGGYLEVGLMGFLANAALFFGVSGISLGVAIHAAQGTLFPGSILVYSAGAVVGETFPYLAGRRGVGAFFPFALAKKLIPFRLPRLPSLTSASPWRSRLVIFLLSLAPIPFDFFAFFAGKIRMPAHEFFLFAFLGRIPKYWVFFSLGERLLTRWI